jgi:hypothetical protein
MRRLRQSINQPRRQGSQRPQCPSKPAHTEPLPGGPADDAGTDCVDDTGNLVTRNPGEGKAWPLTFHCKTVTVTHPAGLDTDPHLALRRLRHLALNQFKRTATLRHLYRPHLSHGPSLYRVRLHFTPTYSSWLMPLWSTARHNQCFTPEILSTTSSKCHLSPARGRRRRIWLANCWPNLRAHRRTVRG